MSLPIAESLDLGRIDTVFDPNKDLASWAQLLEARSDRDATNPTSVIIASADTLLGSKEYGDLDPIMAGASTDMYRVVADALEGFDGLKDYFLVGAKPYIVSARSHENPKSHLIMGGSEIAVGISADEIIVNGVSTDIRDRLTAYVKGPRIDKLKLSIAVGRATLNRRMANSDLLPSAYLSVLKDRLSQLGVSQEVVKTVIAAGVKLSERSETGPAVITRLVRYAANLLQSSSTSLVVNQQ